MSKALVPRNGQLAQFAGQVDNDGRLIELWLHGKSANTRSYYRADVERFLSFVGRPLPQVTLGDLQAFADALAEEGLAPSSQARKLAVIKSLLAFGARLRYLPFDVGAAVRAPSVRDRLSERILTEEQVQKMLALETDVRNHALLRLMYGAGLRVSEACALKWRDLQPREDAGQVNVFGKGGKTRNVLLSHGTWEELEDLRRGTDLGPEDPVFVSRKGGHLGRMQVFQIVREAARRAGIKGKVSPHWLRHAHASHALDRGAPPHLVQATLGHANLATTSRYAHAKPTDSSARYLAV